MTTPTFTNRASTTTYADIEDAIPYGEMRRHAIERRDGAAGVIDELGDEEVLDLYEIDGVLVLWSDAFCYGVMNRTDPFDDCLCLYAGEKPEGVVTPAEAAAYWHKQHARR